jgi:hypothetical protein
VIFVVLLSGRGASAGVARSAEELGKALENFPAAEREKTGRSFPADEEKWRSTAAKLAGKELDVTI